jgi:hypothetical protein
MWLSMQPAYEKLATSLQNSIDCEPESKARSRKEFAPLGYAEVAISDKPKRICNISLRQPPSTWYDWPLGSPVTFPYHSNTILGPCASIELHLIRQRYHSRC